MEKIRRIKTTFEWNIQLLAIVNISKHAEHWTPRALFSFFLFSSCGRNRTKTIQFYKFTCLLLFGISFIALSILHTNEILHDIACRSTAISKSKCIVLSHTHHFNSRKSILSQTFSMFFVLGGSHSPRFFCLVSICPFEAEAGIGNRESAPNDVKLWLNLYTYLFNNQVRHSARLNRAWIEWQTYHMYHVLHIWSTHSVSTFWRAFFSFVRILFFAP